METLNFKTVLRESYDPHGDGWDMYLIEFAIKDGEFYKRITEGGNGWYGNWKEYKKVAKRDVIHFLFNTSRFYPSEETIESVIKDLMEAPALEEANLDPMSILEYMKSISIDVND